MDNLKNLLLKGNKHQLILIVLFVLYILLDIKTPENLAFLFDNMFGQKIDVFMESIGQTFSEYLVNFDFFRDYMEKNGFKLMSPTVKKRYHKIFKQNNITKGFGDFGKVISNLTEIRDDEELLQENGYYAKAMDMNNEEIEPLKVLSSLNNYFIFQKI